MYGNIDREVPAIQQLAIARVLCGGAEKNERRNGSGGRRVVLVASQTVELEDTVGRKREGRRTQRNREKEKKKRTKKKKRKKNKRECRSERHEYKVRKGKKESTQYHVSSTLRFVSFLVSIFFDVVELDGRLWHDTEKSSTQKEDEQSRGRTDQKKRDRWQ